jgi:hypothetical protein
VIRAVIDNNVLVSGLLSPAGNEALIVLAIHQGFVRPCLSEAIIAEYTAVRPSEVRVPRRRLRQCCPCSAHRGDVGILASRSRKCSFALLSGNNRRAVDSLIHDVVPSHFP